jgi:hypothetical protein
MYLSVPPRAEDAAIGRCLLASYYQCECWLYMQQQNTRSPWGGPTDTKFLDGSSLSSCSLQEGAEADCLRRCRSFRLFPQQYYVLLLHRVYLALNNVPLAHCSVLDKRTRVHDAHCVWCQARGAAATCSAAIVIAATAAAAAATTVAAAALPQPAISLDLQLHRP